MTVNQQALKAFNQFADNFDCDSDQWQDMGANEYFIAGFQAAQQSDDWNHAAKQCMNNLLDAHEKLDRDALTKALNSIRILTGR